MSKEQLLQSTNFVNPGLFLHRYLTSPQLSASSNFLREERLKPRLNK